MHNTVLRASRRLAVNLASTKVVTRKFASTHVAQKSTKIALVGATALVAGVAGTVYLNSNTVYAAGPAGSAEEEKLRASFLKHASSDINGEKFMTPDDFLTALGSPQEGRATIDRDKFLILFRMADSNKNGLISFDEFVQFENLMTRSDAEYLLAFKLFDRDNNGFISKEDFKQVAATDFLDSAVPFDFNCELMRLYFGKGTHELSYNQFTQLLKDIQQERVKQEFKFYDKNGSGYIPADKFVQIINSVKLRKIPEHVKQRLETIADMNANTKHEGFVSYAQFVACNDMLLHIPSYARVLLAAENTGRKMSSKDDFLRVAQDTTSVEITPMEVDLIFHLFDTDKDGMLSYSGYNNLVKSFNQVKAPVSAAPVPVHHSTPTEKIIETVQNFALGSVAGAVGATAVYPIDLVKTRMQNQRAVRVEDRVYKNSWDCFRKVLTNEGFTGLYRGLGPQCVGVAPEKAIKLTVNSLLRDLFEDKSKGEIYFPLEVLAGGSAGASQVLFTNPLEIVKIRLQVQGEGGVRAGAGTIIRELGLAGLYKGAGACLLRDIPFSAIYFPTYAKMKNVLADDKGFTGPWELLLAGAVAGIPAASLVTPADVIKTRLQVKAKQGEQTYSGIRDCAIKVWKAEGFRAFFKGCLARVFRSSPQFGVTLWTYEQLQRNLFPHITPKPPTNAPVTKKDFEALRPSTIERIEQAEQKFGLRKDKQEGKGKENQEKKN